MGLKTYKKPISDHVKVIGRSTPLGWNEWDLRNSIDIIIRIFIKLDLVEHRDRSAWVNSITLIELNDYYRRRKRSTRPSKKRKR